MSFFICLESKAVNAVQTDTFLRMMTESHDRNQLRSKNGYRYSEEMMLYASYMRMIGGALFYETFKANSKRSVPSISAVDQFIAKTKCTADEGVLRIDELDKFLTDRNLPRVVALSEDGTRINGRVQYNPRTNKIVGFVLPLNAESCMPATTSYKANCAADIESCFYDPMTGQEIQPAQHVNVLMASVLVPGVPPFCLLVFGTDCSYTNLTVYKRWQHITEELRKRNIEVISISTDSDPKFNGTMRKMLNFKTNSTHSTDFPNWFNVDMLNNMIPVQDTIHIGTKLRNRLLNSNLMFGKHTISVKHLTELVDRFPKCAHRLTHSIIQTGDRQNFESVLKISDDRIIALLSSIPNRQGTVLYLKILRNVLRSYLDLSLTPLERIRLIWVSNFLLRIWRQFILENKSYKLKDHFVTLNTYSCVEINAHSLVLIILELKAKNLDHLFNIESFSSQPCEGTFRQVRSLSSTYSTVTDCSLLEFMHTISRMELQNDIMYNKLKHFNFPRLACHRSYYSKTDRNGTEPNENWNELPNMDQIITEIEMAKLEAVDAAKSLGVVLNAPHDLPCTINSEQFDFNEGGRNQIPVDLQCDSDVNKHILPHFNEINLSEYSNKKIRPEIITESSPYVRIENTKGEKFCVKKHSLCWLLSKSTSKLSSNRLIRVMTRTKTS